METFEEKMGRLVGEILVHATDPDDKIFFEPEPEEMVDPSEIIEDLWYR